MNREILYRGKQIVSGEWIYGVPISNDNITCIFKLTDGLSELKGFQVKTETVGQYTGLTDKNGTKIFEGDIIKWHDEWIDCDFVGVVEFDHCSAAFKVRVGNELIPFSDVDCEYVIKAGNIHNNPELLGG